MWVYILLVWLIEIYFAIRPRRMSGSTEEVLLEDRRLHRLALEASYQVLTSLDLGAKCCDGCRDGADNVESHLQGCQLPLLTIEDSLQKAHRWCSAYVFYGCRTAPVHWSDLELIKPRMVDILVYYNWNSDAIQVSGHVMFKVCVSAS